MKTPPTGRSGSPLELAKHDAAAVEHALHASIERATPELMRNALRHAVFSGGARVRPRFCLAVGRAAGASDFPALAYAAAGAIELLHGASLVHDDLPCFDDAAMRRGRITVHRAYGEATAVLVGDALIIAAFESLARAGAPASMFLWLTRAAGAHGGLVSGQAMELEGPGVDVRAYHAAKTASLFEAAAAVGAEIAGVDPEPFASLGRKLGLFYQLADDAADSFGDAAILGKPVGNDVAHARPNAVGIGTRATVKATLDAAADDLVASVPTCPGRDGLRHFLAEVTRTLIARTGVEEESVASRATGWA